MIETVLGVDIGGTNTVLYLTDRGGSLLWEGNLETRSFEKASDLVDAAWAKVQEAIVAESLKVKLLGIGIGAPNGNHLTGVVENAPNLKWKGRLHFSDMFEKVSGKPAALTNDANAAALGERKFGDAKGMNDFIVITIGTGLGSGVFVGGHILEGARGMAGEAGHCNAIGDGRPCTCGKFGCVEAYVSARGLVQTALELQADFPETDLGNPRQLTPRFLQQLALEGDALALEAYARTGDILGRILASMAAMLDPEAIFIHGGVAAVGEPLFGPARQHLELNLLPFHRGKVKLYPSGLKGRNAGAMGAAALIWSKIDDPEDQQNARAVS